MDKEMDRIFSDEVAPLAGAWVEILSPLDMMRYTTSLLSRERGLKYLQTYTYQSEGLSLLSRERGLKY